MRTIRGLIRGVVFAVGAAGALAATATGCVTGDDEAARSGSGPLVPTTSASPGGGAADPDLDPDPESGGPGEELGRFMPHSGLEWVYVAVEPGVSDEELVALATELHEAEPDVAKFIFMDDDSQMDQVLAALPETEQGNTDNWPVDWVTEHTVATLELALFPDEPRHRWVLGRGTYADLDNPLLELP